ncbi:exonuclease SbcCD subunit D [Anaerovorax odorimutans]|uniref:exonuclease SbcCD subunit D n=1 Tax=Anaerovorax odorimutans TaxID=109327 RepID=UPI0004064802|nr:exonuclease SbcCD subunit D [Anaerovorax odorimutans]
MKFLHISDLHLGKRVYEFSMIDDQKYILDSIIGIIVSEKPEAVIIAGDIYDKAVPSAEAVELFDNFITELSAFDCSIFIISGNHDSGERLNYGSRIMSKRRIYISGSFDGNLKKEVISDKWGDVHIYMMPFLKPSMVRHYFKNHEILTYEDAIRAILENEKINGDNRNILIAHQFVTGSGIIPETCDSEMVNVGGVDNVDVSLFDSFDYVALGHLHGPQKMARDTIRYSGSILKYSFSEVHQKKSATIIEMGSKQDINIRTIPLKSRKDLREIKGPIKELLKPEVYNIGDKEDYLSVILTDEESIMDPIGKLRLVYPNIMRLEFENSKSRKRESEVNLSTNEISEKSPIELFENFYTEQNGIKMSNDQRELIGSIMEKIMGGGA